MKYEINDFSVDVKGNIFKCRPWTSKEERTYLSVTSEETSMDKVAKMLMFPNLEFKPMMLSEFYYLLMEMRKLSIGAEVSLSVDCSCGQRLDFDKSIDDLVHFVSPKITNDTILKAGDIEVKMRRIPSKDLLLRVLEQENEEDRIFFEFLASVENITYKGETNETFTFDELEEFFDSVPSKIFRELFDQFFHIKGHLQLFSEVKCIICSNVFDAVFRDIPSFLGA